MTRADAELIYNWSVRQYGLPLEGMATPALVHSEVVCLPGLEDAALFERLADARRAVMTNAGKPVLAPRYRSAAS